MIVRDEIFLAPVFVKLKVYPNDSAWEFIAPLPLVLMGAQCVNALASVGSYIPLNVKVSILYCCFSIFHYSLKNPNKLKCKNSNIYSSMKKYTCIV